MAALARRWRQGDLADEGFDAAREALTVDWPGSVPSIFSSFDRQLNRAARAEGLAVLDAESDLYPFKAVASDSSEVHGPGAAEDYPATLRNR